MANHGMAGKVKLLVVGDSGVGKTSLVHLITQCQPLINSSWTIGCSVDVTIHEYREGTPDQRTYFIELWDVGGNNSHKNARHVFYNNIHGVILVHDLTNRKTQQNLLRWLTEVLLREGSNNRSRLPLVEDFDAEQFGGFSQVYGGKKIPVLVVGTRQESIGEIRSNRPRISSIADECAAEEIYVNCLDPKSLGPGSSNAVKLTKFFDKVIERNLLAGRGDTASFAHLERENNTLRRNKSSSYINIG